MEEKGVTKGERGMALFLGIIATIFMIGIIVMIFIMGNNAIKNASAESVNGAIDNESIVLSTICQNTSVAGLQDVQLTGSVLKYSNGTTVPPELYTIEGGCIRAIV